MPLPQILRQTLDHWVIAMHRRGFRGRIAVVVMIYDESADAPIWWSDDEIERMYPQVAN